jgi:hypothetical protein
MNTKRITFGLGLVVLVAALATIVTLRPAVGIDVVVGYGAVVALIGMAAIEYRLDLRRVLGLK